MRTLAQLETQAVAAGFESYSDFAHEEQGQRVSTLTCTKGKYSGEVIDIIYDYKGVISIDHSTQFKDQRAFFRFIGN